MKKNILLVENNSDLVDFIKQFLEEHGEFTVTGESSGIKAIKIIKNNKPDIAIIDLGLDDVGGDAVCKEIRKEYLDIPIIVLTGDKSNESKVNLLNLGADDYITKPFNPEELVARVNAKLRLFNRVVSKIVMDCKNLTLNTETFEVERNGKKINLTAKEYELLKYLVINKNMVLTRDKILFAVWGYTYEVDTRVVDVHIGKLRKKVDVGHKERIIESVRGFGYKAVC